MTPEQQREAEDQGQKYSYPVSGGGKVKRERPKEQFWVLANSRENFETLKRMGEALEKKDGGSVTQYNDTIKT